MATYFYAEIPTHHKSQHKSEAAAVKELIDAQNIVGIDGQVVMVVKSGTYRSSTVVYPKRRETVTYEMPHWPR